MLDCHLEPDCFFDDSYISKEQEQLDGIQHYFEAIMKQAFGKEKFNCEIFEHCLDEIANILEIKPLSGPLAIGVVNV